MNSPDVLNALELIIVLLLTDRHFKNYYVGQ